ncbi:hypothetical protein GV794_26280 [Nocardia cyriacigeorgica]|uniref:Low molecular weight antigen MTB12-like C-terminal domain-containing protein n=1 Tax=Nocardia cyriacigeorgica TaxID=135487 RepID=A0A6P1D1Q7_9NOCA|nr:hypothetical protein [Nocardia cyriacigeorgica]NEW40572.1 hypothetical protein [Nocardia cyriacigeorgica]NEW42973.1 hypothetical protein [Nocardia cyriacigeorgica]NEW53304.1 hypothetical protein [Nocardia cyriacigeorgica]NEW59115.1 hypothetical protein [Nocardia cyriacigeorgica]
MNLQGTRLLAIAGTAVALALSAATAAADSERPPLPTAADLDDQLTTGLDPATRVLAWIHPVRNEHKLAFVQGAQADPELPYRLAQTVHEAGAQLRVVDVDPDPFGDAVYAKADVTLDGQTSQVEIPFVVEDGTWKVQLVWACTMLSMLGEQSPTCA